MKRLLTIAIISILITGCNETNKKTIRVEVPVPYNSIIEQLPVYEPECDKLTLNDRENYEKVAKACKKDLEIYKRRDEIHRDLIERHNAS